MGKALGCIFIHLVFGTKNRNPLIGSEVQGKLQNYLVEIVESMGCELIAIHVMVDHIHILFQIQRDLSVSQFVKDLKRLSSRWMKTQGEKYRDFSWQVGYGAFSVSKSQIPKLKRYIGLQDIHHQTMDFSEEFEKLLLVHEIQFDHQYLWD